MVRYQTNTFSKLSILGSWSPAMMLAIFLMAILFGLISTTANLIVICVTAALIFGAFLLSRPSWIVWIVLIMGLLIIGIPPLYDVVLDTKAGLAISLLCFLLLILALLKVFADHNESTKTPVFIWVLLCFFVYTILNSLIQWHSAGEFFGGLKRYFQTWGLLFAFCWIGFNAQQIHQWKLFFLFTALLQLPFSIYEIIVWLPFREAIVSAFPGMVPIDVVSGTFGATVYGGGASGEMSTFLVMVFGFLLAEKMHKSQNHERLIWFIPLVLAPLFIGETKAVIVMLPLMLLVLYRRILIAKPHYGIFIFCVGVLFTIGLGYAYLTISNKSFDDMFSNTLKYNVYGEGYGNNYLNRTTVLTFWADCQGMHDPISFLFGTGIGSSHEMTFGHTHVRYPRYGIGLTAASTLLWDLGVVGCGLILAFLVLAWRTASQLYNDSNDQSVKANAVAIEAAIALFLFHLFYRIDLLETLSIQIVFAAVLGYLAWLYKQHLALMT